MFALPPLPPDWDGFHPLIVHFPIGLLAVAPVLVFMGLLFSKHERGFNLAALALMLLGTGAAFLAVSTGDAAEDAASVSGAVHRVIHEHEEAAEFARNAFVVLTLAFAIVAFLPVIAPKLKRSARVVVTMVFLVLYGGGLLPLMNAGHLGGQLVHTHGVRARLAVGAGSATPESQTPAAARDDDDEEREEHE